MENLPLSSKAKMLIAVAALGYFVDVYDLILFSVVRNPSLKSLGLSGSELLDQGLNLMNIQMGGMLLGGILWGVYGDKKGLVQYLQIKSMSGIEDANGRLNTTLNESIKPKFEVPINYSLDIKLRWFEGICDSDGSISRNGTNESIQICSIEFDFLDKIRLMLITMGIQSKVTKSFDERINLLPDGKGGKKEFNCKPLWRILISSNGLYDLSKSSSIEYSHLKICLLLLKVIKN